MKLRSPALGRVLVAPMLWAIATAMAMATMAAVLVAGSAATPGQETARPAVLVELFTSQGCSSCPPADRLVSRLSETLSEGTAVVPLAFHVDYWNYIGWKDPFSSSDWSERQRDYADRLESRGVYTPQIVVNGQWDAVGSNESAVTALIQRAHDGAGTGQMRVEARLAPDGRIEIDLAAAVSAKARGGRSTRGELVLWLAVVESGFETPVGRGENIHKTLHNDHVVRRLLPALELDATGANERSIRIDPDPGWKRGNLSFAAFVQDRATMRVYGATSTRLVD